MGKERVEVKKRIEDEVAGCVSGWSVREDQSGRSSFKARGSITAPESMCEPASREVD